MNITYDIFCTHFKFIIIYHVNILLNKYKNRRLNLKNILTSFKNKLFHEYTITQRINRRYYCTQLLYVCIIL